MNGDRGHAKVVSGIEDLEEFFAALGRVVDAATHFDRHRDVGRDGVADTAGTRFEVTPSVHPAAFEERWRLVLDDGQELRSTALRAWDKTAGRWMYTWVSDNGLYQVWEGRKDRHGWWVYRHFDVDGDRYLSRQGFFPLKDGSVLRISQKSYDEGITWEERFRQRLARAVP